MFIIFKSFFSVLTRVFGPKNKIGLLLGPFIQDERVNFFCYNTCMKKLLLSVFLLLSSIVFGAEPFMVVKPFRETFLHFPSSTLAEDGVVVTVFLPEASVPLHQKYPVVYMLGVGPEDAQAVKDLQDSYTRKTLLVGLSLGENSTADAQKISTFIAHELVPYIDANYLTLTDPMYRALAVSGAEQAKLATELARKKELFGRFLLLNPGEKALSLAGADPRVRVLLAAERGELVVWQETLEDMGLGYGADFVTKLIKTDSLTEVLNPDYLFADSSAVRVKKLTGAVYPKNISLETGKAFLSLEAVLSDGSVFDYIALSLRLSPPYLHWNAADGVLIPIAGAEAGKVKISVFVDKKKFSDKIQLKK